MKKKLHIMLGMVALSIIGSPTPTYAADDTYDVVGTYQFTVRQTDFSGSKTADEVQAIIEVRNNGSDYWMSEVGGTDIFQGLEVPFSYNPNSKYATFKATYAFSTPEPSFSEYPYLWVSGFVFNGDFIEPNGEFGVPFNPDSGFSFGKDKGLALYASSSQTVFEPVDVYIGYYILSTVLYIPSEDFADPSIAGDWSFTLNGAYVGNESLGMISSNFTASLKDNTVTFTSEYDEVIIATFTEVNTLTFNQTIVGNPSAMYSMTQFPFTATVEGANVNNIEDFTFGSFDATYDPENGTITFPAGCGIAFGFPAQDGEISYLQDAFDLIKAVKNSSTGTGPGSDYSNSSIIGDWQFDLNYIYTGAESLGKISEVFKSTLKDNTVTFVDQYGTVMVATFTADNVLTFSQTIVGDLSARYPLTQYPFTASTENAQADNPGDFTFGSFDATYDPEEGTITFPEGCGLAFGNPGDDNELEFIMDVFDLLSAAYVGGSDQPTPGNISGTMTAEIDGVSMTWDVTASLNGSQITVNNFAGLNPVVFAIDIYGETGDISSETDIVAETVNNVDYYYADTENDEFVLYGNISNINEEQCRLVILDWGTAINDNGEPVFQTEATNTLITLNVYIPGIPTDDGTGIDSVTQVKESDVIYFDLNGRKINNPVKGIFIKKSADKVEKTIINN